VGVVCRRRRTASCGARETTHDGAAGQLALRVPAKAMLTIETYGGGMQSHMLPAGGSENNCFGSQSASAGVGALYRLCRIENEGAGDLGRRKVKNYIEQDDKEEGAATPHAGDST